MACITIKDNGACVVRGALALVLRASRVLGLAPLLVRRARTASDAGAWSVQLAPPQRLVLNYLLFLAINSILIVTLYYMLAQRWLINMFSKFSYVATFIWIIEIARFITVFLAGTVGVRARMLAMTDSLKAIEKVHLQYKSNLFLKRLYRKENIFVGLTFTYLAFGTVYALNVMLTDLEEKSLLSLLSLNRVLLVAMMTLVEAQFTLAALRVNCAFKTLNHALTRLVPNTDSSTFQTGNDIAESIRRITMAYELILKAVNKLNDGFGFIMLIIYCFYVVYMTLGPYFVLVLIIEHNERKPLRLRLMLEILVHFIFMQWGVQPGDEMDQEVQIMRRAASELFSRAPSSGDRAIFQLKKLYYQLELSDPCYSPMGVFTLRRPLIYAIIRNTVTLTVVLLQVQESNL